MVKPTHLVVAGTLARHQVALDVRGSLKNKDIHSAFANTKKIKFNSNLRVALAGLAPVRGEAKVVGEAHVAPLTRNTGPAVAYIKNYIFIFCF